MPKILEFVTGRRAPAMSIVPDLDRRLADAQSALDALESNRGNLALDVALGKPDADAAMAAFNAQIAIAAEALKNTTAALATAKHREAAELADARAAIRRTQVAHVSKLLRDYMHEIEAYQAALLQCEEHFREALRVGDEARDAAGKARWSWPMWAAPGNYRRLMAALETEAWRIGCGPEGSIADRRFPMPGARHHMEFIAERPDTKFASRPMDFVPLLERQKFEIEQLKQLLRGDAEAPIEAPPMPTKPIVVTGPAADDLADLVGEFHPAENAADTRIVGDIELVAAIRGSRFTLAAEIVDGLLSKFGMTNNEPRTIRAEHRLPLFQALDAAEKARVAALQTTAAE